MVRCSFRYSYVQALQRTTKSCAIDVECLEYLASHVDRPKDQVLSLLKKHPHWHATNAANLKAVVQLLSKNYLFTPEQISQGLHLVLYPVSEVSAALEEFINSDEWSKLVDNKSDPLYLQFVLYSIEKKYNFSGNAVR